MEVGLEELDPDPRVVLSICLRSSHDLMMSRVSNRCECDLYASKIGKKMVTACIMMIPGASLKVGQQVNGLRRVEETTYHIGGTQNLLTWWKVCEYKAASHIGDPGRLGIQ